MQINMTNSEENHSADDEWELEDIKASDDEPSDSKWKHVRKDDKTAATRDCDLTDLEEQHILEIIRQEAGIML
jgi:hypothetical protein